MWQRQERRNGGRLVCSLLLGEELEIESDRFDSKRVNEDSKGESNIGIREVQG